MSSEAIVITLYSCMAALEIPLRNISPYVIYKTSRLLPGTTLVCIYFTKTLMQSETVNESDRDLKRIAISVPKRKAV